MRTVQCLRFRHSLTFARLLIDQALKVWSVDRRSYKPEIARTSFLKSKLCRLSGDDANSALSLATAVELLKEINGLSVKGVNELDETDFDQLVTFWSR
jgi:hypothetical protein